MCECTQHKIDVNSEKDCSLPQSEHLYLVVDGFIISVAHCSPLERGLFVSSWLSEQEQNVRDGGRQPFCLLSGLVGTEVYYTICL